jgi:hypothetical protein
MAGQNQESAETEVLVARDGESTGGVVREIPDCDPDADPRSDVGHFRANTCPDDEALLLVQMREKQ